MGWFGSRHWATPVRRPTGSSGTDPAEARTRYTGPATDLPDRPIGSPGAGVMNAPTRSAVLAVLAMLAVAFAAATLESAVDPEGGGLVGPAGGATGSGGLFPRPQTAPVPAEVLRFPFPTELFAVLVAIAAVAFVVSVIVYWRETLGAVLVFGLVLGFLYLLIRWLAASGTPLGSGVFGPGNGSILGGGGGTETARPSPLSLGLLIVLGLAIVGTVLAILGTLDDDADDRADGSGSPDPEAAAVGRAAGRAADRLEAAAAVDNEVYRAWLEMTELLDVDDPATSTPGEFAAAAVEAGLGRADIDELTRLFEDVRYGDRVASAASERRAIAVFRRIEARYAEADP